ncbi:hypothetical protein [Rhodoflexus caldus]|uniref:hypothetical protein n=1 Tax=Rhodoflexus caldus TaxID=2891236 RepID=UPI00202A8FA4|nr:hypothetical protein [Rhodoflexus caldus]
MNFLKHLPKITALLADMVSGKQVKAAQTIYTIARDDLSALNNVLTNFFGHIRHFFARQEHLHEQKIVMIVSLDEGGDDLVFAFHHVTNKGITKKPYYYTYSEDLKALLLDSIVKNEDLEKAVQEFIIRITYSDDANEPTAAGLLIETGN